MYATYLDKSSLLLGLWKGNEIPQRSFYIMIPTWTFIVTPLLLPAFSLYGRDTYV